MSKFEAEQHKEENPDDQKKEDVLYIVKDGIKKSVKIDGEANA